MSPDLSRRRFVVALLLIALTAITIRSTYVVLETQKPDRYIYDAQSYKVSAWALAEGLGFSDPVRGGPMAEHPPMTAVLMAPIVWAWGQSDFAVGLEMAALGTVNVVLISLLGRRLWSARAGLIAGAIAAVYPGLWVNDGLVMSETPTVTILVLCLLATYRLLDRWRTRDAVVLGALCGLAALTRGELLLVIVLLPLGVVLQRAGPPRRRRLALGAMTVGVSLLVLMPWVTYNVVRFPEPVFISTNLDVALWDSSCHEVFYGPETGSGTLCPLPLPQAKAFLAFMKLTPLQRMSERRDHAVAYIGDHLDRFPVVLLARAGRTWSLFRPFDVLDFKIYEGRPRWVSQASLVFYYPLLLLAVWGAVVARRRIRLWPLLVPPVIVTVTALVVRGLARYRTIAEPVIVVLAAVALDELIRRRQERRGSPRGPRPEARAAEMQSGHGA